MRRIHSKDTRIEIIVRRLVYSLGYRYRLHYKGLPGTPDIVFPGRKKIIFVHGCFWHQHDDPACKIARTPASRPDYWLPKLHHNVERDKTVIASLEEEGWQVAIVWECDLKDLTGLASKLIAFLE